jgi:predicted AAA+ superfamily ATPase
MDDYFCYGGFPESFDLLDKREWVNSLYQKILLGDIVARHGIRNPRSIRLLAKKMADSVMQPTALSRLQHVVKSTGEKIGLATVKDYLEYFEESYLTFSLPNYVSPLTDQETIKKRYYTDNGLLNNFLFNGDTKLLENLCAVHLMKQYSNTDEPRLFYYSRNIEVDFYVPEAGLAIQASFDINDEETRRREVSALVSLHRAFSLRRAVIVTRDHEEQITEDQLKIEVIPVWKWLLE